MFCFSSFHLLLPLVDVVICSVWACLLCKDRGSLLGCALLSCFVSLSPHSGVCHSTVFSFLSWQRENEDEKNQRGETEDKNWKEGERRVWWCLCQWGDEESSMKAAWWSTNWMSPTLLIRTMKAIITVGCWWDAIFRCIQLAYCVWLCMSKWTLL